MGTLPGFRLRLLQPLSLSHPIAAAPTKEVRRILILNESGHFVSRESSSSMRESNLR